MFNRDTPMKCVISVTVGPSIPRAIKLFEERRNRFLIEGILHISHCVINYKNYGVDMIVNISLASPLISESNFWIDLTVLVKLR